MNLETHNYWDNFLERAEKSILNKFSLERLTVHLTSNCNLNCKYCNLKRDRKTMNIKIVKKIIEEYSAMNGNIIHFTGGEPTVVPYLPEIIDYAFEKGLKVSLNTNAVERINDISKISKLKCSFDGYWDGLNYIYGKENAVSKIIDNLKHYSSVITDKQVFSITCLICQSNFKLLYELAEFTENNFHNLHNLYFSAYKGNNKSVGLSNNESNFLFNTIFPKIEHLFTVCGSKYSKKQLSVYTQKDFSMEIARKFPEYNRIPCYLQLSELTIGCNYKIYNCSHLYRDGEQSIAGIDIRYNNLPYCYKTAKAVKNTMIPMSNHCYNGCNRNIANFNKYVYECKNKLI